MKEVKKLIGLLVLTAVFITGVAGGIPVRGDSLDTALTNQTQGDTSTASDAADNSTAVVSKPVKQYGILVTDKAGKVTLKDFSGDTDGRVEATDTGNIMIPLKKVTALMPDLKYVFDTKTKKVSVRSFTTKKKLVFTIGSSTYFYYSSASAKGVKKLMPYSAYVSKDSKSVMVHMSVLKWLFSSSDGVKYYTAATMQAKGYDTTVFSGIIVYNPYQNISNLMLASQVSNIGRTVKVTIPEGYSLPQTFALLVKKGVCVSQDLLYKAMNEYDFTVNYPLVSAIEPNPNRCYLLEGYLYPDTYEFNRLSKGEDAIGKFLRNGKVRITDADKQKAAALGYSIDQILTIASIIEKEGNKQDIMNNISSVIYNRLNKNMKLQMDSTINYVEWYVKPFIDGDINRYNSYYNTYKCAALPAGPICNPGRKAIDAALNPPQTEYLYFHSDKGNYFFSSTLN
ncbi:endolytic transglycosylase MltG [Anaerocolumna chitinilytica]|uniref:Endolytic murein transglycosylase n=1 Tax=Anaerocolumna chitinilytica TaxID=1727145 RepID=A0A7I8DPR1_9FIRM|nr:endolytic transglycosylase MltG [Anaerocolumna chitinilytica]BCK00380.1 hypothetical protein bsdcttw_34200 [Anaerocolumna chitinilytica]